VLRVAVARHLTTILLCRDAQQEIDANVAERDALQQSLAKAKAETADAKRKLFIQAERLQALEGVSDYMFLLIILEIVQAHAGGGWECRRGMCFTCCFVHACSHECIITCGCMSWSITERVPSSADLKDERQAKNELQRRDDERKQMLMKRAVFNMRTRQLSLVSNRVVVSWVAILQWVSRVPCASMRQNAYLTTNQNVPSNRQAWRRWNDYIRTSMHLRTCREKAHRQCIRKDRECLRMVFLSWLNALALAQEARLTSLAIQTAEQESLELHLILQKAQTIQVSKQCAHDGWEAGEPKQEKLQLACD